MAVADTSAQLEQLKAQQELITQALVAMVNGTFVGDPPSLEALLVQLDPTLEGNLTPRTPKFQSDAEPWWNPATPAVIQQYSWNCSCASTSWVLQSMGKDVSQFDVINHLGPTRVNSTVGLCDGTGAALAALIQQVTDWPTGCQSVTFDEVFSLAGTYPMALGFHGMYHWVACSGTDGTNLVLANPSPGYEGVANSIDRAGFLKFGPVSAVWCEGPQS